MSTLYTLLIIFGTSIIVGTMPTLFKIASVIGSSLLPKKIRNKYQNSKYYLNNAYEYGFLLKSNKISDKIKLKLLNKKLLSKFNGFSYIDIVNSFKSDDSKLTFLLKDKTLKNIINIKLDGHKISLSDENNYEVLYNFLDDNEKYKLLSHISNDKFVIEKYNLIKKNLNDYKKSKIICNLENDENKLLLIKDITSDNQIYDILSTFNSFEKVENYILKLNDAYQTGLVSCMSDDEINKFLAKNLLIEPILKVTNKEEIFSKYFTNLNINNQIDILKENKYFTIVCKYYKLIENSLSDEDKMRIIVKFLKSSDQNIKKAAFELLPNCLVKTIASSNENEKICEDIKYFNNVDNKISFGVELESSHKDSTLIKTLDKFNYSWRLKGDSSITNGVEIVSPILHYTQKDLGNLKYVCDFMKNNGFVITSDCGGHIHVGFDYFKDIKEIEMLYMIYTNTQDVFFDICNRKGSKERPKLNSYAKPISNTLYLAISTHKFDDKRKLNDFVKEMKEIQNDRFFDINLKNAQSKLKNTIEFRFPNGEINYDEVLLNVTLIIKLCMAAKKYAYINEYDEKYLPVKLLQSDLNKDARKNILLKMLFEDDENLKSLYNERYESNNIEDVFTRKYVINFNGKKC